MTTLILSIVSLNDSMSFPFNFKIDQNIFDEYKIKISVNCVSVINLLGELEAYRKSFPEVSREYTADLIYMLL